MDIEKQTSFLLGLFNLISLFYMFIDPELYIIIPSNIVVLYLLFRRNSVSGSPTYILTSVVLILLFWVFMLFTAAFGFGAAMSNDDGKHDTRQKLLFVFDFCLLLVSVYSGYLGYHRFSISN